MTWTVRLHTIPEERMQEIEQYCIEASLKDYTFKYVIESENIEGKVRFKNIIIECTSRDHAFKRGTLFHHKFGCYFEVEWRKEKDG